MKVIGFCGKAGAGKTTSAKFLQHHYVDAPILSFADAVKKIALAMGWRGDKGLKGRRLLQLLGTECGRCCIDENLWLNKVIEQARYYNIIIIDDVRFMNEALWIKEHGHLVQIIGREETVEVSRIQKILNYFQFKTFTHPSEYGIKEQYCDAIIDNSGTLEALREEIKDLAYLLEKMCE